MGEGDFFADPYRDIRNRLVLLSLEAVKNQDAGQNPPHLEVFSIGEHLLKRQTLVEGIVLFALIALGAQVRTFFQDLPNFAPVAALALFAGYYFRSWAIALCVPLGVMVLSDAVIGAYDGLMMLLVYAMLALPVLFRSPLRRYLNVRQRGAGPAVGAAAGLVACSLAASLMFFFVTNFGSWLWFDMYQHTWTGLVTCYVQAIPFFRHTAAGDLLFAVSLFGGYGLVSQLGFARTQIAMAHPN